jgi:hypothetical protein
MTETRNIADTEAIDIYISNAIAKGTDIEQKIDIIEETVISTCRRTFDIKQPITTGRRTQSRGGIPT